MTLHLAESATKNVATGEQMQAAALRLHLEGCSVRVIAERLCVSASTARKYLDRCLRSLDCEERLTRHQLREIEHARLELCVREVMPLIVSDEIEVREDGRKVITVERFNCLMKAVDVMLKISKRISALYGLDAPRQVRLEGGGYEAVPPIDEAELSATTEARRRILMERFERVTAERSDHPGTVQPLQNTQRVEGAPVSLPQPLNLPAPICGPVRHLWQQPEIVERPLPIQPWMITSRAGAPLRATDPYAAE